MNVNIKAFDKLKDKELPHYIDSLNTSDSLFMITYNDISDKEMQENICCLNINIPRLAHTIVSILKQHPEIAVYINTMSQLEYIKELKNLELNDKKVNPIGSV